MGYIERNLMPGEELLLSPRYHWVRFAPAFGFAVAGVAVVIASRFIDPATGTPLLIAGGALVGLALLAAAARALSDSFDEFGLTSSRVFKKHGFLTRDVRQIPLDKVQDVNIRATLWGRWLSYGDVELQTAGTDGTVVFPRIRHPEEMRNVLFTHLHPAYAPAAAGQAAAQALRPPSLPVEARLRELTRLRDGGLVTEQEYAEKRRALLEEL